MNLGSLRARLGARRLAVVVFVLGAAQPAALVLAFSRMVDPGAVTFDAIGSISGLGMAAAALAMAMYLPPRRPRALATFGTLGVVAGLVSAGVWLSLVGGTFFTNDTPRIAVLIGCDVAFAIWLIAGSVLSGAGETASGFTVVALMLSLRAIAEIGFVRPLLMPDPGQIGSRGSGAEELLLAGALLFGYIVLAAWEISVGLWLWHADLAAPAHSTGEASAL
jgi:hypothetical protein